MNRSSLIGGALALAASALLVVSTLTVSALGGFSAATANSGNTVKTGSMLLKATPATSACDTALLPAFIAVPTATCAGSSDVPAASPGASTLTVTADGTLPSAAQAASASASVSATTCGPVRLQNATDSTDPMLVRGGVSYAVAGPLTGSTGLGLDGVAASHSMASDVISENSAALLGSNFSAAVWFNVSSGNSGPLFAFGSSPNDTAESTSDYPVMWIDSSGAVHAGARSTLGSVIANSTGSGYNNGAWHLAVVTISSAVLTMTVSVYVDSAPVGSQTVALSLLTGFIGYWHAGWSPASSSPWSSGTPNYLNGKLADAAVFPSTLSAASVASLATSGSQSTWQSRLATAGAIESWPLGDDGTTSYTGTLPVVGSTSTCTFIDGTVGGTGFCIYPNALATSCSAPIAANKLSALVAGGPYSLTPIVAGASKSITTTTVRDSSYATSCSTYCPGLHLLLPLKITETIGGFGSALAFTSSQTVI